MRIGKLEGILILSAALEVNPFFQAVRMWKTGAVRDVSPWTFLMILAIGGLWFTYGIRQRSRPLIAANGIKLVASCTVLVVYVWLRW